MNAKRRDEARRRHGFELGGWRIWIRLPAALTLALAVAALAGAPRPAYAALDWQVDSDGTGQTVSFGSTERLADTFLAPDTAAAAPYWNSSLEAVWGCSGAVCFGQTFADTPTPSFVDAGALGGAAAIASLESGALRAAVVSTAVDQGAGATALLQDWIFVTGSIPAGGYTGTIRARLDGFLDATGHELYILDGGPVFDLRAATAGAEASMTVASYGNGFDEESRLVAAREIGSFASGEYLFELPFTVTDDARWVKIQMTLKVGAAGVAAADFGSTFRLEPIALGAGLDWVSQSGLLLTAPVPEPSHGLLLIAGLGVLIWRARSAVPFPAAAPHRATRAAMLGAWRAA